MRQKLIELTSSWYFHRENDHADEHRKLKYIVSAEGSNLLETIVPSSSHWHNREIWHRLQEGKVVIEFICMFDHLSLYYKLIFFKQPLEDGWCPCCFSLVGGIGTTPLLWDSHSWLLSQPLPSVLGMWDPTHFNLSFQVLLEGGWFVNTEQLSIQQ